MTRRFLVDARLIAARAAGLAVATASAPCALVILLDVLPLMIAARKHRIVGEGVVARVAVTDIVFLMLGRLFVFRYRHFAQITRILVVITMRLVARDVLVICMISMIRCHNAVIMILRLLRRMLCAAVGALIVRSMVVLSLLFSFIIVIASTMIKVMGMIMSLMSLH
jgi:hypothetical protein